MKGEAVEAGNALLAEGTLYLMTNVLTAAQAFTSQTNKKTAHEGSCSPFMRLT